MNNADDIRKGFEAEFKQIISGSESLLVRFPYRDRRYVDWNTEHCWLMWKAAIESQATRIAELEAALQSTIGDSNASV